MSVRAAVRVQEEVSSCQMQLYNQMNSCKLTNFERSPAVCYMLCLVDKLLSSLVICFFVICFP